MFIVQQRLSHPHKNYISDCIIRPIFFLSESFLDIAVSKEDLRNHLFPSQIPFETEFPCYAKEALHRTPNLRRNTKRNTVQLCLSILDILFILPVIHKDCLNQVPISRLESELCGINSLYSCYQFNR